MRGRGAAMVVAVLLAAGAVVFALTWPFDEQRAGDPGSDQEPSTAAVPAPGQTLSGRVVDGSGRPIAGAVVVCGAHELRTDAAGGFELADLPEGAHQLDARAPGFVRPGRHVAGGAAPGASVEVEALGLVTVKIAAGQRPKPVILTLRRPASLEGHVLSMNRPVAGVRIDVRYRLAHGMVGSVGPYTLSAATTTDRQGRFRLDSLSPGRLHVTASGQGGASASTDPIDLREGEQRGGVLLQLRPAGSLSGTVRSRDGAAVAAHVAVVAEPGAEGYAVDADDSGRFAIEAIPPGTWIIEVSAPGFKPLRVSDVQVVPHAALSRTLVLEPIAGVNGQVVDQDDRPVSSALVILSVGGQQYRIDCTGDGRFNWHRPGMPLDGATALAISPRHGRSPTLPAHEGEPILLRLKPGGHIAGRVVDAAGGPVLGALVHLAGRKVDGPDPYGMPRPDPAHSQPDGSFRIADLRPGLYDLRAALQGHPPGVARGVVVTSGAEASVVITLDAGATVRGRVSGADGAAAVGARVQLLPELPDADAPAAVTDEQGLFRFDTVAPGPHKLHVAHAAHLPELVAGVVVPDRGELVRDIALRSGAQASRRHIDAVGIVLREGPSGPVIEESTGVAAAAGLRAGDVLAGVDFMGPDRAGFEGICDMLEAGRGGPITLEVQRPGEGPVTLYLGVGAP